MKQPRTVYKFRALSHRTLGAICTDQLYFSQPSSLNDPFECAPVLRIDSDIDTLRGLLQKMVYERFASEALRNLTAAKAKGPRATKHAERVAAAEAKNALTEIAFYATDPEYEMPVEEAEAGLLSNRIRDELLQRSEKGICSLTASYRNPLLWSHYGDEHRGFCVGYTRARNPVPELHPVQYGGSRELPTSIVAEAILNGSATAQSAVDEAVLLRKARSWEYEREWRLLGPYGPQSSVLKMTEIIFGLRCPAAIVHTVIQALHGRREKVAYWQIWNDSRDYLLKRQSVDVDELEWYFPHEAESGVEIFGPPEGA
jgi:hypothetical protein